jgi:hypothetical protein
VHLSISRDTDFPLPKISRRAKNKLRGSGNFFINLTRNFVLTADACQVR